ncbi:MAG: restriction endonuclease subunit S domain-containing protein [Thermoleophilia bacterium]
MDAHFFLSAGALAAERLLLIKMSGVTTRPVAGEGGYGIVRPTTRTKRVYAGSREEGTPYLRPYDVFDYLPRAADVLASETAGNLRPAEGTILQTCSGRNLGPLTLADRYISQFAVSDDMLRLWIPDVRHRFYVMAFLSTNMGQSLLRRNKTGGVIDHLSSEDLAGVEVPVFADSFVDKVAKEMQEAARLRESARVALADAISSYAASLPGPQRSQPTRDGWTIRSAAFDGRLDAAYYDNLVSVVRSQLLDLKGAVRCEDVADPVMPPRYVRYYVEREHGLPILSGRQLLQVKPVNLRFIAARSFDPTQYALKEGWIAFGGEGRAQDRMGTPAMVTEDRAGWLASEHVMRLIPHEGVSAGWLYLALSVWQVQIQVRAIPCGSVVDELQPGDVGRVVLPPPDDRRGDIAAGAWRDLGLGALAEKRAIGYLEEELARAAGEG